MSSIVSQDYWDSVYTDRALTLDASGLPFKDLFDQYLPKGGDCFEVGCYPGDFLAYLCRKFGYRANGIDRTPFVKDRLPAFLRTAGICVGKLFCGDFFATEFRDRYDVVCSFGFIEHFTDFAEAIEKHVSLVKPGGFLVMSCPNFRRLQYVLHWAIDRENLRRHVLSAMDLRVWNRVLRRRNMQILHAGYYGKIGFWHENAAPNAVQRKIISFATRASLALATQITKPNRFASPYMICICQKPNREHNLPSGNSSDR